MPITVRRAMKPEKKGLRVFKKYQLAAAAPAMMLKIEKAIMPDRLALERTFCQGTWEEG